MAVVYAPPNFERLGVVAGFVLSLGAGLTPVITKGVLFAQGAMYRPAAAPGLPAAPANQQSWLGYNSSTGFYWRATPTVATAGDALLGWVRTSGSAVTLVSRQEFTVPDTTPPPGGGELPTPKLPAIQPAPIFDTGVPNGSTGGSWGVGLGVGNTNPADQVAGAVLAQYTPGAAPSAANNMAGVYEIVWEVETYADAASSDFQMRVYRFPFVVSQASRMVMMWPNRYFRRLNMRLVNYFGESATTVGFLGFGTPQNMGSEAQDVKPANAAAFNRVVQDLGFSRMYGHAASGDGEFDTDSASGRSTFKKPLNVEAGSEGTPGILIWNTTTIDGNRNGNFASLKIGGTEIIDKGKVVRGDVAGNLLRTFLQDSRPALKLHECAFWFRPSDGMLGLLYREDTNYVWWRAGSGGTVIAEVNP